MSDETTDSTLNAHGRSIALALGFFTRLPTRQLQSIKEGDMGRVLYYLPLAGLLIGIVSALSGYLLSEFLIYWSGEASVLRDVLVGLVTFSLLVVLTGGLHLDGLADCADAWVGGLGDKDRTLEIMKDPACGPMAVFIMVILLLLKAAAVTAMVMASQWLIIILIPLLSRTAGVALFKTTDYVRPNGMGKAFVEFAQKPACEFIVLLCVTIPLLLAGQALLLPLLITGLFWYWLRKQSVERLGGFTGDVAGGVIELTEASLFLFTALFIV
ncbi:adenosylcobinamide-GDP ribazoletransferase [Endozoicomonas sp. OPT23]|uniref:adenosylcobinamide-GDP ribazoletransferase n=1 Tax=Endozoicomonas sp. OPT23 TaxID=2072845 RepID=UPI00129B9372|nr:adenosylcobinamide-GDP ribazoletransferase [Endozoicomonas sp. OPT23]